MKTPAYIKSAILVAFSLLLLTGSVTFGASTQPGHAYLAIPGICQAPASLVAGLMSNFPVPGHVLSLLHGSKMSIIPFIDDISMLWLA